MLGAGGSHGGVQVGSGSAAVPAGCTSDWGEHSDEVLVIVVRGIAAAAAYSAVSELPA